jgi:hypothetical protein
LINVAPPHHPLGGATVRWIRTCTVVAAAAAAAALSASSASADLSLFWQQVPITATTDASTPPPGIAGYETWDLMMTITPGDDFTSMKMHWDPIAPIFQHSRGQGSPNFGPPNTTIIPTFPALEFDSYVRGPAGGMTLLSEYYYHERDHPPVPIFNTDRISFRAGDLATQTTGGTFQLVRVTLDARSGDSPYHAIGFVYSTLGPTDGVPLPVPEPGFALLAFATAAAFAVPRRRGA